MPQLILAFTALGLEDFSWRTYALLGVVYTLVTLLVIVKLKKVRPGFPKLKPLLTILMIHAVFLTIFLLEMQFIAYVAPFLPNWTIAPSQSPGRGRGISFLDYLFIPTLLVLCIVEQRWLYVQGKAHSSAPEVGSSSTSANVRDER